MIERNSTAKSRILICASALLLFAACGGAKTQTTQQLVDARQVVNKAQMSRTAKIAPDQMATAWQAYLDAEKAHEKDPGSYKEAHLAYVALRKAEVANVTAKTILAQRDALALDKQYAARLEQNKGQQQAMAEPPPTNLGLEGLEGINVKQDENTVVITLSSAVLFPTGEDTLSDAARNSLEKVAEAIKQQPEGSHIRVDGYTDSRGSETFNEQLSQRRAEAVSSYLAEHGVEQDKLTAEGKGEADPVATNDTPDGRASNRRAEIVIDLGQRASATEPGSAQPSAQPGAQPGMNKPQPSSSSAKGAQEPEKSTDKPMMQVPDSSNQLPDHAPSPPAPTAPQQK